MLSIFLLLYTTSSARDTIKQPQSGVEGGAQRALPVGGATRAPVNDELVNQIQTTYRTLSDLQTEFTQQLYVKTLNRAVANTGTLWLKRPGKIRIEYRGATPQQYISDGKSLWLYKPGDTQATVYAVGKNAAIPREALAFLNGFDELRSLFMIKMIKAKHDGAYLELAPKQQSGYTQLDCQFDRTGLLTALTIHNTTGGTAQYHFSPITTNPGLPETLFHFQTPKGVRIVSQKK